MIILLLRLFLLLISLVVFWHIDYIKFLFIFLFFRLVKGLRCLSLLREVRDLLVLFLSVSAGDSSGGTLRLAGMFRVVTTGLLMIFSDFR